MLPTPIVHGYIEPAPASALPEQASTSPSLASWSSPAPDEAHRLRTSHVQRSQLNECQVRAIKMGNISETRRRTFGVSSHHPSGQNHLCRTKSSAKHSRTSVIWLSQSSSKLGNGDPMYARYLRRVLTIYNGSTPVAALRRRQEEHARKEALVSLMKDTCMVHHLS
ncbi:hypothetical protein ACLOJK_025501 [Asimina triloba]